MGARVGCRGFREDRRGKKRVGYREDEDGFFFSSSGLQVGGRR